MRLLLDGHTVLWWLDEDAPMSTAARQLVDDMSNEVVVSVATLWELWIKRTAGRLQFPADLTVQLDAREVDLLPVDVDAAIQAAELPMHHRDPVDRMLIAQAMLDDYAIVTADRRFAAYGVATIAAR